MNEEPNLDAVRLLFQVQSLLHISEIEHFSGVRVFAETNQSPRKIHLPNE